MKKREYTKEPIYKCVFETYKGKGKSGTRTVYYTARNEEELEMLVGDYAELEVKSQRKRMSDLAATWHWNGVVKYPKQEEIGEIYAAIRDNLKADISLSDAFLIIASSSRNLVLQWALFTIVRKMEFEDYEIQDAVRYVDKIFGKESVAMINAGLKGGEADEVFARLQEKEDRATRIKRLIQKALFMPGAAFFGAYVIFCFLMLKMLPAQKDEFDRIGDKIPEFFHVMQVISQMLVAHPYLLGILPVGVYFTMRNMRQILMNPYVAAVVDKIPFFGGFLLKGANASALSTVAMLQGAGIDITKSLEMASQVTSNKRVVDTYLYVVDCIEEGTKMNKAFYRAASLLGADGDRIARAFERGEQFGTLDEQVRRLSQQLFVEYEYESENSAPKIELLSTYLLAAYVLFLMVMVYIPRIMVM